MTNSFQLTLSNAIFQSPGLSPTLWEQADAWLLTNNHEAPTYNNRKYHWHLSMDPNIKAGTPGLALPPVISLHTSPHPTCKLWFIIQMNSASQMTEASE